MFVGGIHDGQILFYCFLGFVHLKDCSKMHNFVPFAFQY
jgi:hypothetical protein